MKKRIFAVVALLASAGAFLKLTYQRAIPHATSSGTPGAGLAPLAPEKDALDRLLEQSPGSEDLIRRVRERYGNNAVEIARTDGLRGLRLLDQLDLEALYLFEHDNEDFRRLADLIGDQAAAEILIGWREYLGVKHSDQADRGRLIAELGRLSRRQRQAASAFPAALPLILDDPNGVSALIDRWQGDRDRLGDALAVLLCLDLGVDGQLDEAVRTLETYGNLAIDAYRLQGLEGFATVHQFGSVLLALRDAIPLEQALIILRVNAVDVANTLETSTPDRVAAEIRHVAARNLVLEVGGSPVGLRFLREFGEPAEEALHRAGPDAANFVVEELDDTELRPAAVAAIAEHGAMALAMLAKYADDPDFQVILRQYGPGVIPPIARVDASPEMLATLREKSDRTMMENIAFGIASLSGESGQGMIRLIRDDGLQRAHELERTGTAYHEFLPLYDMLHLGDVVRRGYSPTRMEFSWALIDACFVIADAASLVAMQPGGIAASEIARSEVKAAAKGTVEVAGRRIAEEAAEAAGRLTLKTSAGRAVEHASRWWAVRAAGGIFATLRNYPEALGRIGVREATELSRPYCARAGLRLTDWAPLRFVREGQMLVRRIPADRGLKYLALEATQAGVGVVAIHKMEEHLASGRTERGQVH